MLASVDFRHRCLPLPRPRLPPPFAFLSLLVFATSCGTVGACNAAEPLSSVRVQRSEPPTPAANNHHRDNAAPSRPARRTAPATNIDTNGKDLLHRFPEPPGCARVDVKKGSYAAYLRNLALKPHGTPVRDYSGDVVPWGRELGAVLQSSDGLVV